MPSQEEHEKIENMVESPHHKQHSARTLEDEVDSNATLEGYYAMNNIKPPADFEKLEKEKSEKKGEEETER